MALKKSERKLQMREEARRKIKGSSGGVTGSREYREKVEQGRRQLLMKSAEGGDSHAQQFKAEIHYLINNYVPSYDARIEALIDKWRTSGDPAYDPEVRVALRRARQKHMQDSPA
ncbi:MAG TPA: hypothetical protein PLI09_03790 [Candidatus Hydrogenedentes bacterium]|nr:hypothetical protein [Candidatus Hydrogenedentota bacterium]